MKNTNVIEIRSLHKSFGAVHAVDDLSLNVREGELFAFLGDNGAGKSTTISILCGVLKQDAGEVFIDGKTWGEDAIGHSKKLGVVFQDSVLDRPLSVLDNLRVRAALYGIVGKAFEERLKELCELLEFSDLLNRPVGKLSGGQRRRIDIARALLHRPKILILDEPTTGLDPQTRTLLWSVVEHLRRAEGLTVFLTTHYMEEAAGADYVVILDSGKIAAEGTPLELKNTHSGDFVTLYGVEEAAARSLSDKITKVPGGVRLAVKDTACVREMIAARPDLFSDFEVHKGNMDDVFLSVTGKRLRGEEH